MDDTARLLAEIRDLLRQGAERTEQFQQWAKARTEAQVRLQKRWMTFGVVVIVLVTILLFSLLYRPAG